MRRIVISISVILWIAAGAIRAGQTVDVPIFLNEEQGMASAISHPMPPYSKTALQLKMEGRVGLNLSVNREGEVYDTVITFGNPVLTQMAVDGVKQWKFKPFHDQTGKLVKAAFPVTFEFQLPKSPKS